MLLPSELIVTCVSDLEGFAREVYDYLYSTLEKQGRLDEGRNLSIDRQLVTLTENEIRVDNGTMVPKRMVKWVIESFLHENHEKFKDYELIEIGDTFTIGKILPPSEMEMVTCEICGYFTPYAAELQTHRMTHFGV